MKQFMSDSDSLKGYYIGFNSFVFFRGPFNVQLTASYSSPRTSSSVRQVIAVCPILALDQAIPSPQDVIYRRTCFWKAPSGGIPGGWRSANQHRSPTQSLPKAQCKLLALNELSENLRYKEHESEVTLPPTTVRLREGHWDGQYRCCT